MALSESTSDYLNENNLCFIAPKRKYKIRKRKDVLPMMRVGPYEKGETRESRRARYQIYSISRGSTVRVAASCLGLLMAFGKEIGMLLDIKPRNGEYDVLEYVIQPLVRSY